MWCKNIRGNVKVRVLAANEKVLKQWNLKAVVEKGKSRSRALSQSVRDGLQIAPNLGPIGLHIRLEVQKCPARD